MAIAFYRSKFFWEIIGIKILGTIFAVFVFAKISSLGDADRYVNANIGLSLSLLKDRTFLADFIISSIGRYFGLFPTSLVISCILGLIIYRCFRTAYPFLKKTLFWLIILLPSFLVWSGSPSKEALVLPVLIPLVYECVQITVYGRVRWKRILFFLAFAFILRPHYAISYSGLTFLSILFSTRTRVKMPRLSIGVHYFTLVILAVSGIIALAFTKSLWERQLLYVMRTAEAMFLPYKSKTNRLDIIWESIGDFFSNIVWGLPSSFIGPTFMETIKRPAFLPFFLEGIFSILLLIMVILNILQLIKVNNALRKVVIYGFLPAVVIAIIIHYPFGIFNPGSATRYKQALVPLLYFYPLLLQGEWRRKRYFEKQGMKEEVL
jgi:hypothetical protein